MAVLPSEFSEFAFGYTVTTKLVNFRVGAISPWPSKFGGIEDWILSSDLRKPHVAAEVKRVLMTSFDLEEKQALAVIDAYGAPFIPTQSFEKRFPVDLAMNSNGVYFFLQYKRSTAVKAKHWKLKELQQIIDKDLKLPLYRVHVGGGKVGKNKKSAGYEQWENLKELEKKLEKIKSAFVGYAAPAFHELSELSELHNNGLSADMEGRSPVVFFKASKFNIPDNKRHWVSFDGTKKEIGQCYSSEPNSVREIVSLAKVIREHEQNARSLSKSIRTLRTALNKYTDQRKSDGREMDDVPKELSNGAFLSIFGISVSGDDAGFQSRYFDSALTRESPEAAKMHQEVNLAEAFKKIVVHSEEGLDKPDESRVSFLEDLYHADYRCRQILGYPLMVGAKHES